MTDDAIPWFRELFDNICDYKGRLLFCDVLTPWIEKARPAIADFGRFRRGYLLDRNDEDAQFVDWNLYALSRVNDLLLPRIQNNAAKTLSSGELFPHEYLDFFNRLGFDTTTAIQFSPFHHEIVRVQPSDDENEPIDILEVLWPGLMFGEMMFSRSGVEVVAGRKHAVKEVAESSTLYFTFRRPNRKTEDISIGWGSNSQWRTSFRRDYQSDGIWTYNFDGDRSLNSPSTLKKDDYDLSVEERIELCKYRCFVRNIKEYSDLWPYDDRFDEPIVY